MHKQMALSCFHTSSVTLSKITSSSQLNVILGVRNSLKHKRIVRMISMESNDHYPRAFTELVIFAHSKIHSHIINVKPKSRYLTLTNHANT